MRNTIFYVFLLLFLAFCTPKTPFSVRLQQIDRNVQTTWAHLERKDQQKHEQIKKLIAVLEKMPEPDQKQLDTNKFFFQKVLETRLTPSKMAVSDNIDRYDLATEKLLKNLENTIESLPNEKRSIEMDTLWASIQKIDSEDLGRRVRYDDHAEELNQILRNQQDSLRFAKKKYRKLKPLPKFQLGE